MQQHNHPRVLLVEPSKDVRDMLTILLECYGFTVLPVTSGAEALENASLRLPDAVIVELLLSDMNGLDLVKRLRQLPHAENMSIVVTTGWASHDTRSNALAAGCNYFFIKPAHVEQLLCALRSNIAPAGYFESPVLP